MTTTSRTPFFASLDASLRELECKYGVFKFNIHLFPDDNGIGGVPADNKKK